jgi:hypothetical protein
MRNFRAAALLAALLPLAAWAQSTPSPAQPPRGQPLSAPGGRYVFGQISDFRSDQYLLDTQTGRVWQIVLHKTKGADGTERETRVLDWIPYIEAEGRYSPTPR